MIVRILFFLLLAVSANAGDSIGTPVRFTGTMPVTGTFWQSTQPVSLASMPSTPVTGTFWQSTQPVSIASMPTTAVTGSFYQSTQPVSIASMPTTAVTGSFYQSTQPVSIASMPSTPVTGTFWQNTQPVSLASAPTTPVTGTFWQTTQPVSGTFWQTTQPVSIASMPTTAVTLATAPALVASSAVIGHVIVDTAPTTAVTGTFYQATQPVSGTFYQATQPVSIASMPTTAVTLATAPALVASSAVIGHVIVDTAPTTAVTIASLPSVAVTNAGTFAVQQSAAVGNPCLNPSSTLVSITGATSGTAAVQIVALSGTTKIYVCSLSVIGVSGTTPTFSLVQGTGSNCATGQTVVQQSWTTTAGAIYAFANPVAVGVAGNELCYLDTGTTPIQKYTLTYVQI